MRTVGDAVSDFLNLLAYGLLKIFRRKELRDHWREHRAEGYAMGRVKNPDLDVTSDPDDDEPHSGTRYDRAR